MFLRDPDTICNWRTDFQKFIVSILHSCMLLCFCFFCE